MQQAKVVLKLETTMSSDELEQWAHELIHEAKEHLLTNNGEAIELDVIECEKK